MEKSNLLPIEFKSMDGSEFAEVMLCEVLYNHVTFLKDFGVFKGGEKWYQLAIDYDSGMIDAYDEDDNNPKSQEFTCTPKRGRAYSNDFSSNTQNIML